MSKYCIYHDKPMTNSITGEEVLPGCMVLGVHHDCEKCPNLIDMGDESYHAEPKKGYDPEYIQSCIDKAKANRSWGGVDVDEFMEKVRPSKSTDLDTEIYNWLRDHGSDETRQLIEMTARHFWKMAQSGLAMLHIADKSYKMGRRDERMEMMKDAVEYEVYDFSSNKPRPHIYVDTPGHITGDKVKVIILKAEDEQ